MCCAIRHGTCWTVVVQGKDTGKKNKQINKIIRKKIVKIIIIKIRKIIIN